MVWKHYLTSTILSASLLSSAGALALPSGGQVNGGQASITSSASQTTINQTSQRTVIDWNTFNVGTNEKVQFNQPSSSAIALNRIHDSGTSTIDGQLLANGNVWLINPNGVLFGKNAQVNVGGLLATASDIPNNDFMAGNYNFTPGDNPNATITNNGSITVAQSGLAALVAPSVVNNGTIQAKLGTVALGSGDSYTLDLNGDGLINFQASPAINAQLVANHGTIKADGGTVTLTTGAASSIVDSLINMDGLIQADTVKGKTGKVVIRSNDKTDFSGTIDARGSADGGDGGYAEVSGHTLRFTGNVDLSAPAGKAGKLLIDPFDLFITADGSAPEAGASGISATTVQNLLANEDVTLSSTGTGSQAGDITVTAPITWASDHILGLDAFHSLIIGAPITITNLGGLILTTNDGGTGGTLTFPGGNVTFNNLLGGLIINGNLYTLVNNIVTLANDIAANPNGFYALAKSYDASADGTYSNSPITTTFTGAFEGLGNTISNLAITAPTTNYIGFFSILSGTVENVGLTNINIVSNGSVIGGLAGDNEGGIRQVYATGEVSGGGMYGGSVGGLVGYNSGTISQSYATANVAGATSVGGLVGNNGYGTVSNSYATGNVTGYLDVGGLAGGNYGTISNSYATGNVTAPSTYYDSSMNAIVPSSNIGGLVGVNGSLITQSYATGNVIGSADVGGLVGATNLSIIRSYATGNVTGVQSVGGLVGSSDEGTISQSQATGNVGGMESVGALVGLNFDGSIANSYATGSVSTVIANDAVFHPGGALEGYLGGIPYYSAPYYEVPGFIPLYTGTYYEIGPSGPVVFNQSSFPFNVNPLFGPYNAGIGGFVGSENYFGSPTNPYDSFSNPGLLPATGTLPDGFSNQIWGIAANLNNGTPYLLWQYPLASSQGSGGGTGPGGSGSNSGNQSNGGNTGNGSNGPAGSGGPSGGGTGSSSSSSPTLDTSDFNQVIQDAILQSRQQAIADFLGNTNLSKSPGDLSPSAGGGVLVFDSSALTGSPQHDDAQSNNASAQNAYSSLVNYLDYAWTVKNNPILQYLLVDNPNGGYYLMGGSAALLGGGVLAGDAVATGEGSAFFGWLNRSVANLLSPNNVPPGSSSQGIASGTTDAEAGGWQSPENISTANPGQATSPRDLNEQILWNQIIDDPAAGEILPLSSDSRFAGWNKMQVSQTLPDGENITIHYQYDPNSGQVADMKIVTPQRVPPVLQPGPSIITP